MKRKNILLALIFACIYSLTFPAFANYTITVTNKTDVASTIELPQMPFCAVNVLAPGESTTLESDRVKRACRNHDHDCLVNIFQQPNCDGPAIAQIELDVETGITNVTNYGVDGYSIEQTGNAIVIVHANAK